MILINDTLWEQMTQTQTMYEEFSNHRHDHELIIKEGDMIWLDARNLATERWEGSSGNDQMTWLLCSESFVLTKEKF